MTEQSPTTYMSPYQFVKTKTEPTGHRNVMDLYAFSGDLDPAELRAFCWDRRQQSVAKVFYYAVIFDDAANAKFPSTPFTAEYGIEEDALMHIRAIYCYNKLNGFSELRYYDSNAWSGVATREKIVGPEPPSVKKQARVNNQASIKNPSVIVTEPKPPSAKEQAPVREQPQVAVKLDEVKSAGGKFFYIFTILNRGSIPWEGNVTIRLMQANKDTAYRETFATEDLFPVDDMLEVYLDGEIGTTREYGQNRIIGYEYEARHKGGNISKGDGRITVNAKGTNDNREKRRGLRVDGESVDSERRAAGKLTLAKNLIKNGNKAAGERWLQEIVKDFPDTEAAKDSQAILDGL